MERAEGGAMSWVCMPLYLWLSISAPGHSPSQLMVSHAVDSSKHMYCFTINHCFPHILLLYLFVFILCVTGALIMYRHYCVKIGWLYNPRDKFPKTVCVVFVNNLCELPAPLSYDTVPWHVRRAKKATGESSTTCFLWPTLKTGSWGHSMSNLYTQ